MEERDSRTNEILDVETNKQTLEKDITDEHNSWRILPNGNIWIDR